MSVDFGQYDLVVLDKKIADLKIQSMLFDMAVDWETLSLYSKPEYREAIWITRWKEKEANSDRTPNDYEGGKDER